MRHDTKAQDKRDTKDLKAREAQEYVEYEVREVRGHARQRASQTRKHVGHDLRR